MSEANTGGHSPAFRTGYRAPRAFTEDAQYRVWRCVDRETGARITVTVDTTTGPLAPEHRVTGLCTAIDTPTTAAGGGGSRVLYDACRAAMPPEARTDARAAYLWAREQVRAHVALAATLAPLGVALYR